MFAHGEKNFYLCKAAFFADGGDNQSGYMAPQFDCPLILPPYMLEDSEQKLKPSGHSVNLHLLLFDGRIGLGLDRTTGNAQLGLSRPTASRVTTLLWSSALFLRAGLVHVSLG